MPENLRTSSARDPAGKSLRPVDLLLGDADWVVTCDDNMSLVPGGALAVDKGVVIEAGSTDDLCNRYIGGREESLQGCLLMPGLVNTHVHAAMSCFRGLGDDLPLNRWLHEVVFPAERKHAKAEMVYCGTLLSAVEMLLDGVTTFCDGYFFEREAARAARDSGIRAVLGQGILDFPSPDQPDPSQARATAEAFLQGFPEGEERLRPSLFCHAPYTCGPETLRWVKDLCRERGVLFQIHLSETASEVEVLTDEYGVRPAHYLDNLGILDEGTLCAHGVWLDAGEISLLAERGAGISHNVESNMKLASGIAPLPEMLRAGVRLGLGTDGCASNNDLDLFTEMDRVAKIHKAVSGDPTVCTAREILALATRGGASILGRDRETGSLEAGRRADMIALDLNQPHLVPLYDPVSHLVYAAKGSDVRHVWIDGALVVRDREVLAVDVDKVMRDVSNLAESIAAGRPSHERES